MVQKEEIMETKDLNLRALYKKLLIGLLSIDDFSLDYFSLNRNLREIIFEFLNGSSVKTKKDKQQKFLMFFIKNNVYIFIFARA